MAPRVLPILAAFALTSWACVTRPTDDRRGSTPPKTETAAAPLRVDDKPVIVSLKLRDQTLRVTATGAGPRFLVERSDGVVIARELGDAELEAQHPELYDLYRSGYARGDSYLDATGRASKPVVDSRLDP